MRRKHFDIPFKRYVNDAICHCNDGQEARDLKQAIKERFAECGLELNEEKTKVVYCKDADRKGKYPEEQFTFLEYTFRPTRSKNRWGKYFVNSSPAISNKAKTRITRSMKHWNLQSRADKTIGFSQNV